MNLDNARIMDGVASRESQVSKQLNITRGRIAELMDTVTNLESRFVYVLRPDPHKGSAPKDGAPGEPSVPLAADLENINDQLVALGYYLRNIIDRCEV